MPRIIDDHMVYRFPSLPSVVGLERFSEESDKSFVCIHLKNCTMGWDGMGLTVVGAGVSIALRDVHCPLPSLFPAQAAEQLIFQNCFPSDLFVSCLFFFLFCSSQPEEDLVVADKG